MKKQYNSFYIFCTFRSHLILLIAFICINLFNIANYAYTEGCDNLIGEAVGLTIKLKEDPNFIPQTGIQKAYQLEQFYKERATFGIFPEMPGVLFNSNQIQEKINLSAYAREIMLTDLDITHKNKFIKMLIDLNVLTLKYKDAGMEHYDAMIKDLNSLFIKRHYANVDLNYRDLYLRELMKLYFASKGNPIVFSLLTIYRQNTII
jgi:hypothetical protein